MNQPSAGDLNYPTPVIDQVLQQYQEALGSDFLKYDHHVRRVYYLCCLFDPDRQHWPLYESAAVFHDLGIWTAQTFDYLDPSMELARQYLKNQQLTEWTNAVIQMIDQHHKITAYKGADALMVETFRQADWIDLSFGYIRFGHPRRKLSSVFQKFPGNGFHRFLIRQTLKNLWKHPMNPLPMFKR